MQFIYNKKKQININKSLLNLNSYGTIVACTSIYMLVQIKKYRWFIYYQYTKLFIIFVYNKLYVTINYMQAFLAICKYGSFQNVSNLYIPFLIIKYYWLSIQYKGQKLFRSNLSYLVFYVSVNILMILLQIYITLVKILFSWSKLFYVLLKVRLILNSMLRYMLQILVGSYLLKIIVYELNIDDDINQIDNRFQKCVVLVNEIVVGIMGMFIFQRSYLEK
eukprot:TRINITY_DN5093_c0_g1_i7.p3 TRINITY_DN5093_c0_g1~~TRINITY_DN5093_c0_g1_i7.p3  ORF type:complete len:220 (-),score=-10.30 TRINITY_DN5093_c0_g1_i7:97-756(-)